MPWKKGQSGNPLGRLPGEKQFADQLRIVLAEPVDKNDPKSVRKLRFQIGLERGLGFNHRIERLLHRGRQIICIDVLPLQFFPCHCLAPNVGTPQRERERRRV
jgi:hypothetical protein